MNKKQEDNMYTCECQHSEGYLEYFKELAKLPDESKKLLKVIMEPFEGEEFSVKCKGCADLELMSAMVEASGLPEVEFDWSDPCPADFVTLADEDINLKAHEIARAIVSGESISPASNRKLLMHWAGIDDDELYCRYIEIGNWIAEDRKLREMDDEEMDDYHRAKDEMKGLIDEIMSPELIAEALNHYEEMKAVTDSLERLWEAEE